MLGSRDKQRLSLLDLPDDVLLLIISQVMETDSFHDLVQWTILLLVCKNMCQVGKRFPLQLQMSRDFYDKQVKCWPNPKTHFQVPLIALHLSTGWSSDYRPLAAPFLSFIAFILPSAWSTVRSYPT